MGGLGLSLGKVPPPNPAAQLSLNIGTNNNEPQVAPEISRGGEVSRGVPGLNPALANKSQPLNDEDFDYHGTSRKQYENEMYNGVCSMILDNFLYLGSDIVA